jgi:Cdc6-like AAA superfamily ATPase
MALTLENIGTPICVLNETTNIYLTDKNNNVINPYYNLSNPSYNFQQIPSNKERDILYIAGQSGSGKSYYTMKYIEQYKKKYKKNNIYLFSYLESDPTLDKIKGIHRVNIDLDEFLQNEFKGTDFKNSCVIFDDCECITNKKILNKVNSISNMILTTGRHNNTSCIFISHLITNGSFTKLILNESNSITIFPASLGNRNLKYLLADYLGFDKKEIEKIKNIDSRWITIFKYYPKIIMSEHSLYIYGKNN